jgi:hypothetical protein
VRAGRQTPGGYSPRPPSSSSNGQDQVVTDARVWYAYVVPYDPAKVTPAPPRYQPAADAHGEEGAPVYDDSNPPTWKDFVRAANRARKSLKGLKP